MQMLFTSSTKKFFSFSKYSNFGISDFPSSFLPHSVIALEDDWR